MSRNLKSLQIENTPVQVESAICDGTGRNIVDTYVDNDKFNATITNASTQELTCSDEYEITGQTGCSAGIDVSDGSQMLLTKIQGQTRRYSENLIDLSSFTSGTSDTVTVTKVSANVLHVETSSPTTTSFRSVILLNSNELNNMIQPGKTYTIYTYNPNNNLVQLRVDLKKPDGSMDYTMASTSSPTTFTIPSDYTINVLIAHISQAGSEVNTDIYVYICEGTYTSDTIPPFQPYDNTLVNSKANFLSTGKQLCTNENNGFQNLRYNFKYCHLLPNTTYTLKVKEITSTPTSDCAIDIMYEDGSYVNLVASGNQLSNNFSKTITTPAYLDLSQKMWISFRSGNFQETSTGKYELMLVYGSEVIDYKLYNSADTKYNIELGAYDYQDMNNQIHKATNDIITFTSQENVEEVSSQEGENTKLYRIKLSVSTSTNECVSNLFGTANVSVWVNDEVCVGVDGNGLLYLRLNKTTYPDVDSVKTWLQTANLQIATKNPTETITDYVAPPGYVVYNGGLQQQVIDGKYLPYILTKVYSFNVPAQVLANAITNQNQREQLDQKQNITDNSLTTTNKTVPGAINEINAARNVIDLTSYYTPSSETTGTMSTDGVNLIKNNFDKNVIFKMTLSSDFYFVSTAVLNLESKIYVLHSVVPQTASEESFNILGVFIDGSAGSVTIKQENLNSTEYSTLNTSAKTIFGAINELNSQKYKKPATGIPASDLSENVQDILTYSQFVEINLSSIVTSPEKLQALILSLSNNTPTTGQVEFDNAIPYATWKDHQYIKLNLDNLSSLGVNGYLLFRNNAYVSELSPSFNMIGAGYNGNKHLNKMLSLMGSNGTSDLTLFEINCELNIVGILPSNADAGNKYLLTNDNSGNLIWEENTLADKQNSIDSALQTTSKEIVGAINEVNSKIPALPADAASKTYVLKAVNGTISWVEEVAA